MATAYLGILAHVDVGKTALTGRIAITSAAVAFHLNALNVNPIALSGHGDSIAEVKRRPRALGGAVLLGARGRR